MNIPHYSKSLILRALVVYVLTLIVVIPIAFMVVRPYMIAAISSNHLNPKGWAAAGFINGIQSAIYGVITLMYLIFVVRTTNMRPLLGTSSRRPRQLVILACISVTLFSAAPFRIFGSPGLLGLSGFMIVGLSEEWTFRGVITSALKQRTGIMLASVIASLLFAGSHWGLLLFNGGQQLPFLDVLWQFFSDFLFGLIFTIIVWRGRSFLWAGFVHAIYDWQPWTAGGRGWLTRIHIPTIGESAIVICVIGLLGAEVIRITSRRSDISHGVLETVNSI